MLYCTKCGGDKDCLIDGVCIECMGVCSECQREPIEHDGLCIKCLNAATREAEQDERDKLSEYWGSR
jgi:hypothetical protein